MFLLHFSCQHQRHGELPSLPWLTDGPRFELDEIGEEGAGPSTGGSAVWRSDVEDKASWGGAAAGPGGLPGAVLRRWAAEALPSPSPSGAQHPSWALKPTGCRGLPLRSCPSLPQPRLLPASWGSNCSRGPLPVTLSLQAGLSLSRGLGVPGASSLFLQHRTLQA